MGFYKSNIYGVSGEKFVLGLLKKYGYNASINTVKENRSFYDIIVQISPRKQIFIECKFDIMCQQTGNLCFEYFNPKANKDSGINITKAQIWSHTILDEGNPTVWFTRTDVLKDFIKNTKPFKTIKKGGDGNASLYLYKHETILPVIFKQVENLADEASFHDVWKKLVSSKKKE